jgi:iron-sulfur cluster assembly protein
MNFNRGKCQFFYANGDDTVFEDNGVKVIIDAKSLIYLDGTEVDFVKEGQP